MRLLILVPFLFLASCAGVRRHVQEIQFNPILKPETTPLSSDQLGVGEAARFVADCATNHKKENCENVGNTQYQLIDARTVKFKKKTVLRVYFIPLDTTSGASNITVVLQWGRRGWTVKDVQSGIVVPVVIPVPDARKRASGRLFI